MSLSESGTAQHRTLAPAALQRASVSSYSSESSWQYRQPSSYYPYYLFPALDNTKISYINDKYRVRQALVGSDTRNPKLPRSASMDSAAFSGAKYANSTQLRVQMIKNQLREFGNQYSQYISQILAVLHGICENRKRNAKHSNVEAVLMQIRQDYRSGVVSSAATVYQLEIVFKTLTEQTNGMDFAKTDIDQMMQAFELCSKTSETSVCNIGVFYQRVNGKLNNLNSACYELAIRMRQLQHEKLDYQQRICWLENQLRELGVRPDFGPIGLPQHGSGAANAALQLLLNSSHLAHAIEKQQNHLAKTIAALGKSCNDNHYKLLQYISGAPWGKPTANTIEILCGLLGTLSELSSPTSNYTEPISTQNDSFAAFQQFKAACERRYNSLIQQTLDFYISDAYECSCGTRRHELRRCECLVFDGANIQMRALPQPNQPNQAPKCACGASLNAKTSLLSTPQQLLVICCDKAQLPTQVDLHPFGCAKTFELQTVAFENASGRHLACVRSRGAWWLCDGPNISAVYTSELPFVTQSGCACGFMLSRSD